MIFTPRINDAKCEQDRLPNANSLSVSSLDNTFLLPVTLPSAQVPRSSSLADKHLHPTLDCSPQDLACGPETLAMNQNLAFSTYRQA